MECKVFRTYQSNSLAPRSDPTKTFAWLLLAQNPEFSRGEHLPKSRSLSDMCKKVHRKLDYWRKLFLGHFVFSGDLLAQLTKLSQMLQCHFTLLSWVCINTPEHLQNISLSSFDCLRLPRGQRIQLPRHSPDA